MRRSVLAAVAAVLSASHASATVVISRDSGGPIRQYEQRYASIRASGHAVVIDGRCYSACTMVLGLVPADRVCVTPRARLGFHAAWFPGSAGGRIMSREYTQRLYEIYPPEVRGWIASKGGLSARVLVLEGREMLALLPLCRLSAASEHGFWAMGYNQENTPYRQRVRRRPVAY